MPYPYAKKLLLWPTSCQKVSVTDQVSISAAADENCFIQLLSGKATVLNNGHEHLVAVDTVIVLGRGFSTTIICASGQTCQLQVLRMRHTLEEPGVDLNHMCLTMPIVETFFTFKTRFCLLSDRAYVRMTLAAVEHELQDDQQEKNAMLNLLLQEFFIKLARCYHAHERPSGVQYLTRAREYIRKHFQCNITVDEIAQAAGVSRSYLAQLFALHMGSTTVEYIQAVRCDHAAYLLRTTRFAIVDIAAEVGFNSRQHFARTFSGIYGVTPNEYRHEHRMNHQQ